MKISTRIARSSLILVLLAFGFGCSKSQNPALVGAWKVIKLGKTTVWTSATWTLKSDGTCAINTQQGTWTEQNGLLEIAKSRTGEYRFNWAVNNGGKQFVLTAAPGFAGGQLPPFTLEKVE